MPFSVSYLSIWSAPIDPAWGAHSATPDRLAARTGREWNRTEVKGRVRKEGLWRQRIKGGTRIGDEGTAIEKKREGEEGITEVVVGVILLHDLGVDAPCTGAREASDHTYSVLYFIIAFIRRRRRRRQADIDGGLRTRRRWPNHAACGLSTAVTVGYSTGCRRGNSATDTRT